MTQSLNQIEKTSDNNAASDKTKHIIRNIFVALVICCLLIGLYILSRYNYPLFHSIADGITVFIAAGVFILVWNRRHLLDNHFYLFIGITFLFFAFWDFLHLLGNKGMGVFPAYGNLGPTLYIISRYILAVSFLISPLFIKRKINISLVFVVYLTVTILLLLSVFYWRNFPVTYIDGTGLTPFKIISDYIVCGILLISLVLLVINRRSLEVRVFRMLIISIILSIATGLAFTAYTDPFGVTNAIGHFFQIAAFYMVYNALMETVIVRPQDILYRKMKDSEERFRSVLNNSLDVIYRFNLQTGKYEYMSPSIRIMGFEPEEMTAMTNMEVLSRVHPDDLAGLKSELAQLAEKGVGYSEYRFLGKDGIYRWWSNQLIVTNDEKGKPLYRDGYVRDITKSKKAEAAIKESEQRYRLLFETMTEGLAHCRMIYENDIPVDWVYLDVNSAFENITGLKQAVGKNINSLIPDLRKTNPELFEIYGRVAKGGAPEQFQTYVPELNIWFSVSVYSPRIDHFVAVFDDITDRRRAEDALRESEAKAQALIKYAPTAIYEINYRTGKFVTANDAMFVLSGYSRDELFNMNPAILLDDESRTRFSERIKRYLAGEKIDEFVEYRVTKKDGSLIDVSLNTYFSADKPDIAFVIGYDITERKKMEASLRESEHREHDRAEELAALIDAVPTPVIIAYDPECTHLIGNRAAYKLFRLPSGGEISLTAPPERRPLHYMAVKNGRELKIDELPVRRAAKGENVEGFEYTLVFDDGTSRELVAFATPLKDVRGNPRGAIHTLIDITDRKRVEEALRDSEERFRAVQDNSLDRFTILKPINNEQGEITDFIFVYQNAQAAKLTGRKPEELVGLRVTEIYPTFPHTPFFTVYKQVAESGQGTEFEERYNADGVDEWFRTTVTPIPGGLAISTQIITIRKQMENSLR
ncbi:MAG TPA: MASE3 domain-containing protein, partial [Dehalococcoidales bacterium]|nr:MASE3 domain-containing protein [Dehalococcoidales bacterium]